jgi:hypothetical protein
MSQQVMVLGERKFRVGEPGAFEWVSPAPVHSAVGPPAVPAPALTVQMPGGPVSVTLAVVHAPLTVPDGGMTDLRTLTIAAATGLGAAAAGTSAPPAAGGGGVLSNEQRTALYNAGAGLPYTAFTT